jgi:hypothetical protein
VCSRQREFLAKVHAALGHSDERLNHFRSVSRAYRSGSVSADEFYRYWLTHFKMAAQGLFSQLVDLLPEERLRVALLAAHHDHKAARACRHQTTHTQRERERERRRDACVQGAHTYIQGRAGMSRPNHREREKERCMRAGGTYIHAYMAARACRDQTTEREREKERYMRAGGTHTHTYKVARAQRMLTRRASYPSLRRRRRLALLLLLLLLPLLLRWPGQYLPLPLCLPPCLPLCLPLCLCLPLRLHRTKRASW